LSDLCNGIDSGEIEENNIKKYKKAFKMLDPVCEDLLEEEAEEEVAVQENAVESRSKKVTKIKLINMIVAYKEKCKIPGEHIVNLQFPNITFYNIRRHQ
jgi:hypothetical protein